MASDAPATTNAVKRKVSTADLKQNPNRPAKRRASKACACCRARKVRCNVVENGIPCTNCRLDSVDCVLMESRRRRRPKSETEAAPDAELDNLHRVRSQSSLDNIEEDVNALGDQLSPDLDQGDPFHSRLSDGSQEDNERELHVPHLIYQTQGHLMSQAERVRRLSMTQQADQCDPLQVPHTLASQASSRHRPSITSTSLLKLPTCIRPLPKRIVSEDVKYLAKKGALRIPGKVLRKDILRAYVEYVHPYMPMLDLKDFLGNVLREDAPEGRVSLLLFQAVMFAGSAFVDLSLLRAAGFESRKMARKALFQRARLLYDFDYETDRITLIQALLLLTYWYESPDDQKDSWHWMGVSLSIAHTIGLHRDRTSSKLNNEQMKLWKRIWWSLFMRDRFIALGMRRPTRIHNGDYDVPMLTLDDFETEPFPEDIVLSLGDCSMLRDSETLAQLATMCIEKAKLCLCVSHVLSTQYSTYGIKDGALREDAVTLIPRKPSMASNEVQECDGELEVWNQNLPLDAQFDPYIDQAKESGDVLFLHRAVLRMGYLTTVSALHRPQVLPANPYPTLGYDSAALSRIKVRDAAVEITNIAQQLHLKNLVKCMPTEGVTVLLPAVIIHLLDIKSPDEELRTASLCRFYQCMQVLTRMREIYASAEYATEFLEAAIKKANLSLAMAGSGREVHKVKQSTHTPGRENMYHVRTLTPPPDNLLDAELGSPAAMMMMPQILPFDSADTADIETPPDSSGSSHSSHLDKPGPAGFAVPHEYTPLEGKGTPMEDHANNQDWTGTDGDGSQDIKPNPNLSESQSQSDFEQLFDFDGGDSVHNHNQDHNTSGFDGTGGLDYATGLDFDAGTYGTGGEGTDGGIFGGATSGAGGESSSFAWDLDLIIDMKALDGMNFEAGRGFT